MFYLAVTFMKNLKVFYTSFGVKIYCCVRVNVMKTPPAHNGIAYKFG